MIDSRGKPIVCLGSESAARGREKDSVVVDGHSLLIEEDLEDRREGGSSSGGHRSLSVESPEIAVIGWHEPRHEVSHLIIAQTSRTVPSPHLSLCLESPAIDQVDVSDLEENPAVETLVDLLVVFQSLVHNLLSETVREER